MTTVADPEGAQQAHAPSKLWGGGGLPPFVSECFKNKTQIARESI